MTVRPCVTRWPKFREYEGVTGNMQFKEGSGDPVKQLCDFKNKDGSLMASNAKPSRLGKNFPGMRRAMHMRSVSGVCRMRHIIKALRALTLEHFTDA